MRLEDRSAFYTIIHKSTGKVYFGATVNVKNRIYHHSCDIRLGRHRNPTLRSLGTNWRDFKVVVTYLPLEEAQQSARRMIDLFRHSSQCCNER